MKILIVSSYLPYPLFSGGHIRLYNLIKRLGRKHEITLICAKRKYQTQNEILEVSKICKKVIAIERPKAWSATNVFKTLFSTSPMLLTIYSNDKIAKAIEKELSFGKYDLIHVETFYIMPNVPKTEIPIVLTEHNIEYMVYEKYLRKASFFLKPLLYVDILKLKRKEKYFWKKADKLIAVSQKEKKLMGDTHVEIVPNGVDTNKFFAKKIIKDKVRNTVLFIGDFKWVQNRDSAVYIIKNIWPQIISKNPNLKLWVVGKKIPYSIKKLENPSIIFDENASNETERIFQEAEILLSPIRIGGGSNFKILESMSSGTPVITTELGNEGIGALQESEIIICDDTSEFAKQTLRLLSDSYLYEKISRNGRRFVEENFDWENIAKKLDGIYLSLAKQ